MWVSLMVLVGAAAIAGCQNSGAGLITDPDFGKAVCNIKATQTVRVAGKATLAPGLIWRSWSGTIRYGSCGTDILGHPGGIGRVGSFSLAPDGNFAFEFKADCRLRLQGGVYWVDITFQATNPARPQELYFIRTVSSANMDDSSCAQGQWDTAVELDDNRR